MSEKTFVKSKFYSKEDKKRDELKRYEANLLLIHTVLPKGWTLTRAWKYGVENGMIGCVFTTFFRHWEKHRPECDNEFCMQYGSPDYWMLFENVAS